jgi:hypothetical protein
MEWSVARRTIGGGRNILGKWEVEKMRRFGRRISVLAFCLAFPLLGKALAAESADIPWKVLFDGNTLEGWGNPYDWGKAWAEDDEICLQADRKFFLVAEGVYRDFIFEGEIKLPEGPSNSGFMFRCHRERNRVYGYQAEVDPSDRQWSGGLYDEGRRGWLNPRNSDANSAKAFVEHTKGAFKRYDWNRYRIHCVGPSLRIYVNGILTTDYIDTTDREGHIAIQHHGEAGQVYRFRNLRIRELKAPFALTDHRDMCVFFGYQDPSHFYYAHIATAADDAAHSIDIVNGAPRRSIVLERTKGADWGTGYHDVRVVRDSSSGSIEVFFDDTEGPIMRAVDKTFGSGGIGFGTFDDTGNIDDVMVWAVTK